MLGKMRSLGIDKTWGNTKERKWKGWLDDKKRKIKWVTKQKRKLSKPLPKALVGQGRDGGSMRRPCIYGAEALLGQAFQFPWEG